MIAFGSARLEYASLKKTPDPLAASYCSYPTNLSQPTDSAVTRVESSPMNTIQPDDD
jgi:hypothetical protein